MSVIKKQTISNTVHTGMVVLLICLFISCTAQNNSASQQVNKYDSTQRVGGFCEEGYCDLLYLAMPQQISTADTSAGWFEKGQKLIVTGTVYQPDGKTPAPNVIVYYHHTDNNGYYSPGDNRPENKTRHGHIRGWMKTDSMGHYILYTIRPAPYPGADIPAHIHWMIKEPDLKNEYWTDDLMFKDDTLLLPYIKKQVPENRCGSGIVSVTNKDSVQTAVHNFTLGLNIPNYPVKNK